MLTTVTVTTSLRTTLRLRLPADATQELARAMAVEDAVRMIRAATGALPCEIEGIDRIEVSRSLPPMGDHHASLLAFKRPARGETKEIR